MNRDMSVSAFNPEFTFENVNIRLATNEGNTMMSWVNERGTKKMALHIDIEPWLEKEDSQDETQGRYEDGILGQPIGTAVLNHKLVIFTKESTHEDRIYVLEKSEVKDYDLVGKMLYRGDLGFSVKHPIETLVSYESKDVQKVYWTDNLNQPRVINISPSRDTYAENYLDTSFDFVPELKLKENVQVDKIFGSGEFPPGVIQYAFTYYNKYGQESNIFYTTPLQYIAYIDRGGSPDSKIANSFKLTITSVDQNFEYLRIYSILRTSLNGTPLVKRVQDIKIAGDTATFTDTGLQGDVIDPTELLYKGGDEIRAKTMEQKDGTLFLGNITIARPPLDIKDTILSSNGITDKNPLANDNVVSTTSNRPYSIVSKEPFLYINQLSCPSQKTYEGALGFKAREYYRLGVQFQYKNGKWSEPCWIGDKRQECVPKRCSTNVSNELEFVMVPEFKYTLNGVLSKLYGAGYRKARPVFALPSLSDRTILCQGAVCPTMYRKVNRYSTVKQNDNGTWQCNGEGTLYAQSSWLFRTKHNMSGFASMDDISGNGGGYVTSSGKLKSHFDKMVIQGADGSAVVMSPYLRCTEVMGKYDDVHAFYVDNNMITIHSPELEFDTSFYSMDFDGCKMDYVGYAVMGPTYGDIDIQTSTPPIGTDAAGFVHRSISSSQSAALISGLFYNDYVVDDLSGPKYEPYHTSSPPVDFPVFMWHKNGSLNNDVHRNNRSAELLKKKISNYRWCGSTHYEGTRTYEPEDIQFFHNDELSIVKVDGHVYMGNIETMLTPTTPSVYPIVGDTNRKEVDTDFTSDSYFYLALADPNDTSSKNGTWMWKEMKNKWGFYPVNDAVGDLVKGLCQWREPISMKYKSTPHLVVKLGKKKLIDGSEKDIEIDGEYDALSMVEIVKPYDKETFMGGITDDALKAATWIPCGPAISFDGNTDSIDLNYRWGDTYFQRFECLKTYAFTQEDKNQVVEIASFMCETRVNIDGRYDRNRGQTSNLNMSPKNFNLLNPVYSQMDNFFSYKMLDKDEYKKKFFLNTVTWTKTKQNGADVDLWTNITMANVLEMDGDKGEISKLIRLNNQLICFQDSGISQILYNENTQISTTEGVPIEIANSEKVQGKRYLSDTIGCSNKWSVVQTPSGIYFMDSNDKGIYLFNGQLNNLSTAKGFNTWAKQNIPAADTEWTPSEFESFVAYYDKLNQDVLFINSETALTYSEKFGCFTSFYDYGGTPYFNSLDDMGIWTKKDNIYQHQAGDYCDFFGTHRPFSMTLIGNQEPQVNKIFTNMEFRACVTGEGNYDENKDEFTPNLPFDTLEVWDEYQHGLLKLINRNSNYKYNHSHESGETFLNRKFRIWKCDVPRDNAAMDTKTETAMGIKRFKARPLDRIRNPWAYLKLTKNEGTSKVEIHDIMVTYFG